jgi:hypothetical protein
MGQQDNFGSGFVLGTLFGGLVGGVVGAVVAARISQSTAEKDAALLPQEDQPSGPRLSPTEADIELARRGLEDKIAQLNNAIDDVRQRLGGETDYSQTLQEEHPTQ